MAKNRFNRSWIISAFSQFISWFDFANVTHKYVVIIILMEEFCFILFMHGEIKVALVLQTNIWADSNPAVLLYKALNSN